jgi:hypothetical protein
VNGYDRTAAHPAEQARLPDEAFADLRIGRTAAVQDLDGDVGRQGFVVGADHDREPAHPEDGAELIPSNPLGQVES